MAQFGTEASNSITPDAVAASMITLIEDAKYPGGSCMEVAGSGTRILEIWDIPAPTAPGTGVSEEVLLRNYAPVLAKMKEERAKL
jgi:hypothetical protein